MDLFIFLEAKSSEYTSGLKAIHKFVTRNNGGFVNIDKFLLPEIT